MKLTDKENNIITDFDRVIYTSGDENDVDYNISYTANDIIDLAKGNLKYAQLLIDRANGSTIEMVIEEDIMYDEIVCFNDQYILTGGMEIDINYI